MDYTGRDVVDLGGTWQVLRGHAEQRLWQTDVAGRLSPWRPADVPGSLLPERDRKSYPQVVCVWARRRLRLPARLAGRDAVLKWGGVRFGATAWINGRKVGRHPTIGPATILLPRGLLRAGDNEILLKVPGWAGLPKSKSGFPLVPTGSGPEGWGTKGAAIYDDVYLEFYDGVYVRHVLAMPDPDGGRVTFRATLDAVGEPPARVDLEAAVSAPGGSAPAGRAALRGADPNRPIEIAVSVKDPHPWTPADPYLYTARLAAAGAGGARDEVRFRFGLRRIEVKGGHYVLNGQRLWLRGSNLVFEWLWGDTFNPYVKRYLVDEARAMSLGCFRTHTLPPPTRWLDVADRHGIMILAELPVLYNYKDFRFTPDEYRTWHRNVLLDARGWIPKLWNHPAIVMWVLSNESRIDNAWEAGPFRRAVVTLDPTRPTMRTGQGGKPAGTAENLDYHTCGNFSGGAEGQLIVEMTRAAARKDPRRTLTNSEYMNIFGSWDALSRRWLGRVDRQAVKLAFAECAAEHTEAMRRLRIDAILPYMYAGWPRFRGNNWRADYPTPMAAALQSSMAPVLASLDLFDRNFVAGREVTTPLHLVNDLREDVAATVDVYLTPRDPLFVPDAAALKTALRHETLRRTFPADSARVEKLRWRVPDAPGVYYLAVVVRRRGAKPVVSQRVVRSIARADPAKLLRGRRIVALGADGPVEKWLRTHAPGYASAVGKNLRADVVLICDAGRIAPRARPSAARLREFVRAGGRLVVLNQRRWDWQALSDFQITRKGTWLSGRASRAFAHKGVRHPILAGVDPQCLKRFNGLPGLLADAGITGAALEKATKLLWAEDPSKTVAASLPVGRGEILICLLHLKSRIVPGGVRYDPAAERIFANLLAAAPAAAKGR